MKKKKHQNFIYVFLCKIINLNNKSEYGWCSIIYITVIHGIRFFPSFFFAFCVEPNEQKLPYQTKYESIALTHLLIIFEPES